MFANLTPEQLKQIDQFKPSEMGQREWRRSYAALCLILKALDLEMITTYQEFESFSIPKRKKDGRNEYGKRKIIVSKNGEIKEPTEIANILSGHSKLLNAIELEKINRDKGMKMHELMCGKINNNTFETAATQELDALLKIDEYFLRTDLLEFRLADVAYCRIGDNQNGPNYCADQIKSATCGQRSQFNFNVNINDMLQIFANGLSLTCIGRDEKGILSVVWFFDPIDGAQMLKDHVLTRSFSPCLKLTRQSSNEFTIQYNKPLFRYDVGTKFEEIERLKQRKIAVMGKLQKRPIQYWNEDASQILSRNHQIEQKSINITKAACALVGSIVCRRPEDNCTSVDFVIDDLVRVQDKSVTSSRNKTKLRTNYPYDPDSIDVLQITLIDEKLVYAFPMRKMHETKIISNFSREQLMVRDIFIGPQWKETNKENRFDFNQTDDIRKYLTMCKSASQIPKLTDKTFYQKMIDENNHLFGNARIRKEKTLILQTNTLKVTEDVQ